jgi:1-acyl-sn-glycerol-3-phosphate acyltransferase
VTYVRAVLGLVFNVISTLFFSTLVFSLGFLNRQRAATAVIRAWAWVSLTSFGVRVVVEGEQNVPRKGGGILVFNHQSHLDITALILATSQQIRFGAKIELFSIPVFGAAMNSIGTLKIARDNRSEVLRIYREAASRFNQGILFVLAPEGTRQKEPRLGRFKKGPFVFALNADVPIVPAVIRGAFEVLPPSSVLINVGRWRRTIYVKFLEPIDPGQFGPEQLDRFVDETKARMSVAFDQLAITERQ